MDGSIAHAAFPFEESDKARLEALHPAMVELDALPTRPPMTVTVFVAVAFTWTSLPEPSTVHCSIVEFSA